MKKTSLIFGVIFFGVVAISASRPPVVVFSSSAQANERPAQTAPTRGACVAARSGYEAFCSSHPERELCLAQGGLCRWVNY